MLHRPQERQMPAHPSDQRLVDLFCKVPKERVRPIYERHGVEPSHGFCELVDEIRLDGSNTFASMFRGFEGVSYLEVVHDVARKIGVKGVQDSDHETAVEIRALEHIVRKYLEQASPEERERIAET